jgi:hypothetical protein
MEKLGTALDTVELCIQRHWERERFSGFDPIDELIIYATEPMRARAAARADERYLQHREKANKRNRRYRERLRLPLPEQSVAA